MTRRTSRKLRRNGRSYATKYIDTVPRSMSRDSWLAKWGTPTNAKLKQIIEGSIHGSFLDSAKVVDQAGNVLATWTHSRLAKNSRRRSSLRRNSRMLPQPQGGASSSRRYNYRVTPGSGGRSTSVMGWSLTDAKNFAAHAVRAGQMEAHIERARRLPGGRQGEWSHLMTAYKKLAKNSRRRRSSRR